MSEAARIWTREVSCGDTGKPEWGAASRADRRGGGATVRLMSQSAASARVSGDPGI